VIAIGNARPRHGTDPQGLYRPAMARGWRAIRSQGIGDGDNE